MKTKTILKAVLLMSVSSISAQQNIGIMTNNPKDKLHISGQPSNNGNIGATGIPLVTPTARIEGLNSNNNPGAFTGEDTVAPLYVDSNGDTQVKRGMEIMGVYTPPGGDAITTSTTVNITANTSYQATGDLLATSFTLKQKSIVYISSVLTADIQSSSGGNISDGKSRAIAALILFTQAPAESGISTTSSYMSDGFSYSSRSTNSVNSSFKLSPSCEVVLPPGDYKVVLRGTAIASNNSPTDNYRVIWGAGTGDKLNIIARPL